jgi:hypothetical protein
VGTRNRLCRPYKRLFYKSTRRQFGYDSTGREPTPLPRGVDSRVTPSERSSRDSRYCYIALARQLHGRRSEQGTCVYLRRGSRLVMTPKDTPEGPVLEFSGDVALLRTGDLLVESPLEGIAQHYIECQPFVFNVILDLDCPQPKLGQFETGRDKLRNGQFGPILAGVRSRQSPGPPGPAQLGGFIYNHPPPHTGLLGGDALAFANCMGKCLARYFVAIGGSECTPDGRHVPGGIQGSRHCTNQAVDIQPAGQDQHE